jgi:ParB family chromosome partitioning protein
MHPADLFEAFKQLADSGKAVAEIASVYGVSEVLVKKRLKLAHVAPSILKVYRADKVDLEQVMAYTLGDDRDRQEAAFRSNPDMNAYQIKRTLTEGDIPLTDKRVTFVGLDAYSEAGGGFYQDLFSDGEVAYLTDAALLDRLFDEKLQKLIEDVKAEGWQGVEIDNDYYTLNSRYPDRIYPKPRALTESEEDELSTLRQEYDGLVARHNDEPNNAEFGVRMDEIDERVAELSVEEFDPAEAAEAFAVITMEYNGEVKVRRGLMKKPRKTGGKAALAPATNLDGHPKVSEKLGRELAAIRTTMIAADLASIPQVALAATVHAMAAKLFYSTYFATQLGDQDRQGHTGRSHRERGQSLPYVAAENAF